MPAHQVLDGTGRALADAKLFDALTQGRVVYVAELHDQASHHAVQLQVLDGLARRSEGPVALGMEMFLTEQQPILDRWSAGELSEADFLEEVQWAQTWGFDFAIYRPLLVYARDHGIRVVGLNVNRSLSHAVAMQGVEGLPPEDRARLPELDLGVEAHRAYFEAAMGGGVHEGMDMDKFYQAQVLWDEAMAEAVAEAMAAPNGPRHMVVIAGRAHVEYGFGVPERAARRGAEPFRTVLPLDLEEARPLRQTLEEGRADFLWLTSEREAALPRSGLP